MANIVKVRTTSGDVQVDYNGLANLPDDTGLESRVGSLEGQVADILYDPIVIRSFTHDAGVREYGEVVTSVTLSWATNKTPTAILIDNADVEDVESSSETLTGLSVTKDSNTIWTLEVFDERDTRATKQTSIGFCNGVYYGAADPTTASDISSFILGLAKVLTDNHIRTFEVDAGANEYIYYCCPARLGGCSFSVGGFAGGFSFAAEIDFTNSHGFTEPYHIYVSDNPCLGATTVYIQ